jgi:hypothetical protein
MHLGCISNSLSVLERRGVCDRAGTQKKEARDDRAKSAGEEEEEEAQQDNNDQDEVTKLPWA